ncbi:TPA: tyrosine-type recombinase/integrase [Escherichia coli]
MQHLPAPIHHARDAAQLPVAIDYPAALALRQMSMVHDELPKYLLAPEVSALLHYVPDLRRKMLLATLWNTGARINEALALTRGDFSLAPPYPFVQLATLKQRTEKTFRHSYAMHMLYAGIPLKVLQSLMGHKSISSTEVYTKVFALDVAARHRVQFAMPEADAVALIKQLERR